MPGAEGRGGSGFPVAANSREHGGAAGSVLVGERVTGIAVITYGAGLQVPDRPADLRECVAEGVRRPCAGGADHLQPAPSPPLITDPGATKIDHRTHVVKNGQRRRSRW